jgi:maltoporin
LFRFDAYHTLGKVLGGTNMAGAKVEYGSNHLLWRAVVQQQQLFNNGHTQVDVIGEYRSVKDRANSDAAYVKNDWLAFGARADTQISGPFRFLLEAGIDHVFADATKGDDPQLIKTTACLELSAGDGAGARPTFRLFYTQGFWNDAAKDVTTGLGVYSLGQSGNRLNQVYGNANTGGSAGIQAEAWW